MEDGGWWMAVGISEKEKQKMTGKQKSTRVNRKTQTQKKKMREDRGDPD